MQFESRNRRAQSASSHSTRPQSRLSAVSSLQRSRLIADLQGQFRTSSTDSTVRNAVDFLNGIRDSTKKTGDATTLLLPYIPGGGGAVHPDDDGDDSACVAPRVLVENCSATTPSGTSSLIFPPTMLTADPLHLASPVSSSINLERHNKTADEVDIHHSLDENGPRKQKASRSPRRHHWLLQENVKTHEGVTAVNRAIEAQRVVPPERYQPNLVSGGNISVDPDIKAETSQNEEQPIPVVNSEKLRERADWMQFWGSVRLMRQLNESLISRIEASELSSAQAQDIREWMNEKLTSLSSATERINQAMIDNARLAQQAVQREKSRQDALEQANDLLNAKITEMRRQVALTERALNNTRNELEEMTATAATQKLQLESISAKHSIEMLKLKQELASTDAADAFRLNRLEILETETLAKDEMIGTLQRTIDVLSDENKRLSERVEVLSAAAAVASKPQVASSVTIDAAAIQNMTARQYQRREAELITSNTELRRDVMELQHAVDTLRDRVSRQSQASEKDLMLLFDKDSGKQQSQASSPPSPARRGSSASGLSKGGKPAAPAQPSVYECAPIIFPDVKGTGGIAQGSSLSDDVLNMAQLGSAMAPLKLVVIKSLPDVYGSYQDMVRKVWSLAEKHIPMHPKKDPKGEREMLHGWLVKSIEMFVGTATSIAGAAETVATQSLALEAQLKQKASNGSQHLADELSAANAALEALRSEHESQSALLLKAEEARASLEAALHTKTMECLAVAERAAEGDAAQQRQLAAVQQSVDHSVQRIIASVTKAARDGNISLDQMANVQPLVAEFFVPATPPETADRLRDAMFHVDSLAEALPQWLQINRSVTAAAAASPTSPQSSKPDGVVSFSAEHVERIKEELRQKVTTEVNGSLDALRSEMDELKRMRSRETEEARLLRTDLSIALAKLAAAEKAAADAIVEEGRRNVKMSSSDLSQQQRFGSTSTVPPTGASTSNASSLALDKLKSELASTLHSNDELQEKVRQLEQEVSAAKVILQQRVTVSSTIDSSTPNHTSSSSPTPSTKINRPRPLSADAFASLPSGPSSSTKMSQSGKASAVSRISSSATPPSSVAALRQRIHHERAVLAPPKPQEAVTHVLNLVLEPSLSVAGTPVCYIQPAEFSQTESKENIIRWAAEQHHAAQQDAMMMAEMSGSGGGVMGFSPVPFFTTFPLRSPEKSSKPKE